MSLQVDGITITHAFAVPGADNTIDLINPHTSRGAYSNLDLAGIRARDPKDATAEIVNLDEFCTAKAARQDAPVTWTETTRERYWDMLEALPPAFQGCGGFLLGEPQDHHAGNGRPRFDGFLEAAGDKYFVSSRPLTVPEFKIEAAKFFDALRATATP